MAATKSTASRRSTSSVTRRMWNWWQGSEGRPEFFTLPWRGRVGSHGAQRNVRRGGVTVSPRPTVHAWRDRHPTSPRALRASILPLQGRMKKDSPPPPVLPDLFADHAIDARLAAGGGHDRAFGGAAGDFQQQLGA